MRFEPLTPAGAVTGLPLSHGVRSGEFVFVSGMVAYDLTTGAVIGDDVATQTDATFDAIRATLAEAGLGMHDVVRVGVYLADIRRDFAAFNEVYRRWISAPMPARTAVQVTLADPRVLVEIDVVARAPTR